MGGVGAVAAERNEDGTAAGPAATAADRRRTVSGPGRSRGGFATELRLDPVGSRGRHAVERGTNRLKRHRAVVTRYDELAVRHGATVPVAAVDAWL
ncbi:hypothetical protein GCM10010275_66870 [Streptomyces litmocidini]|nr:hypothetical protein GCM10010275_66870 [Streptomyces litmocidini]